MLSQVVHEGVDAFWCLLRMRRKWLFGCDGELGGRVMLCSAKMDDDEYDSGPCLAQVMDVQGVSGEDEGLQQSWQCLRYRLGDG
jgi:hypothetical protein